MKLLSSSCYRRHAHLPPTQPKLGPAPEHRDDHIPGLHADVHLSPGRRDHPEEGGAADEKQVRRVGGWQENFIQTCRLTGFLRLLQGSSSRVPQEKERVRQVPGEPRGRAGEPKQDPNRGAESTERPLLPQGRVAAAAPAHKERL